MSREYPEKFLAFKSLDPNCGDEKTVKISPTQTVSYWNPNKDDFEEGCLFLERYVQLPDIGMTISMGDRGEISICVDGSYLFIPYYEDGYYEVYADEESFTKVLDLGLIDSYLPDVRKYQCGDENEAVYKVKFTDFVNFNFDDFPPVITEYFTTKRSGGFTALYQC